MLKVRSNDIYIYIYIIYIYIYINRGKTVKGALLGNRIVTTKVKPMLFPGPWEPELRASHHRSISARLTKDVDAL
jgi:hypothetical protein